MILRALCLMLLAAPAFAGTGITSFEPDTMTTQEKRDREPMVETPIWYGVTYSVGSRYERNMRGLGGAPNQFGGITTGATWPWRTRIQGWSEFGYVLRTVYDEKLPYSTYLGTVFGYDLEQKLDMVTVRGGLEYRFGSKNRPWCTAGGGLGGGFNVGGQEAAAAEILGRVTGYLYASNHTRLGLMLSGGPAWVNTPERLTAQALSGSKEPIRTHYEIGLRIESRLRFPRANAE